MTFSEFKKKYPTGSSVANPEGTYKGQCVSLVRRFMQEVDGVKTGALGDAADIPYNKTFLKYYEKVSKPQAGDLMFWGDDKGNWTGKAGHTAIYEGNNKMYNQNWEGDKKISHKTPFKPGFIGYYRLKEKGDDMHKGKPAEFWYKDKEKWRGKFLKLEEEYKEVRGWWQDRKKESIAKDKIINAVRKAVK